MKGPSTLSANLIFGKVEMVYDLDYNLEDYIGKGTMILIFKEVTFEFSVYNIFLISTIF